MCIEHLECNRLIGKKGKFNWKIPTISSIFTFINLLCHVAENVLIEVKQTIRLTTNKITSILT